MAVAGAGLAVDLRHLLQSAKRQRRGERRDDQVAAEPPGQLDRRPRERGDIGRDRALHRFRGDRHIVELVMLAVMRDRLVARPQPAHDAQPFLENRLIVLEGDVERRVFAPVVPPPGGEIDPPARQQIEGRPLLGDPDRLMQRQHRHRRRQADLLGPRRDMGQHEIGARQDAQRAEMMLADPRRMQPDLLGVQRLVENVGDQLVGAAPVVDIVVVAQREIAELHFKVASRLVECSTQHYLMYATAGVPESS